MLVPVAGAGVVPLLGVFVPELVALPEEARLPVWQPDTNAAVNIAAARMTGGSRVPFTLSLLWSWGSREGHPTRRHSACRELRDRAGGDDAWLLMRSR